MPSLRKSLPAVLIPRDGAAILRECGFLSGSRAAEDKATSFRSPKGEQCVHTDEAGQPVGSRVLASEPLC